MNIANRGARGSDWRASREGKIGWGRRYRCTKGTVSCLLWLSNLYDLWAIAAGLHYALARCHSRFLLTYSTKAANDALIKNLTRENLLITTAWYDLTSRLQSNHVVLQRRQDAPKSWLNKQRQMVNATPRRWAWRKIEWDCSIWAEWFGCEGDWLAFCGGHGLDCRCQAGCMSFHFHS